MINPHVHCRDSEQAYKETIEHALSVAYRIGSSAIFNIGNRGVPVTEEEGVLEDFGLARQADFPLFFGEYILLTPNVEQVKRAVDVSRKYSPREGDNVGVVGLKMFACESVGNAKVTKEEEQFRVYETLTREGFEGVLAVHCEKESLMRPELWDPRNPVSHSLARPPESEVESGRDQIRFVRETGYKGRLHIMHVSVPETLNLIEAAKKDGIRISCEVTHHHFLLNTDYMELGAPFNNTWEDAILKKVNPPLRSPHMQEEMLGAVIECRVNYIAEDHAPHILQEKISGKYMSGFPTLQFVPHSLNFLRRRKMSEEQIYRLTHGNIIEIFGLQHLGLPVRDVSPDLSLHGEYEVDVYGGLR